MRSCEEVRIANFMFRNQVSYAYEKYSIERRLKNSSYTYKPDFIIKQGDKEFVYEHFGVDVNYRYLDLEDKDNLIYIATNYGVAPHLNDESSMAYVVKMTEKINFYESNGFNTIYTYSFMKDKLIKCFEAELKRNGIVLNPMGTDELFNKIIDASTTKKDPLISLISTFLSTTSANRVDVYRLSEIEYFRNSQRGKLFAKLINAVQISLDKIIAENQKKLTFAMIMEKAICEVEKLTPGKSTLPGKTIDYLLVDEFQDTSKLKYDFLKVILDKTSAKLAVIGDDWQTIYEFIGSSPHIFQEVCNLGKKIVLGTTYRNSKTVTKIASNNIMLSNANMKKDVEGLNKPGDVICYNTKNNSQGLVEIIESIYAANTKEVGLICRTNGDILRLFGDLFTEHGFFTNGSTYKLKAVFKDGIRKRDISIKNMSEIQLMRDGKRLGIKLIPITIHTSKGLEFEEVIICNNVNGDLGFPLIIEDDPIISAVNPSSANLIDRERRLMYVALTRTKRNTWLLYNERLQSVFISELKDDLDVVKLGDQSDTHETLNCPWCKEPLTRKVIDNESKWNCTSDKCAYYLYDTELDSVKKDSLCPKCKAYMVVRVNGTSGQKFYACSGYALIRCGVTMSV